MQQNCFAGFNVRQVGGNYDATPMVNGAEVGTTLMALVSGHRYTLRLRLHCDGDAAGEAGLLRDGGRGGGGKFGGGLVEAPVKLWCLRRGTWVQSSNTPVTVLYDGAVAATPAQATFVAANSVQLFGSVRRCG